MAANPNVADVKHLHDTVRMSIYSSYRDWADRVMCESAIRAPAVALFPAGVPVLGLELFGVRHPLLLFVAVAWAAIVVLWGFWRYSRILRAEMSLRDAKYKRDTRFKLSKEYHGDDSDEATPNP